MHPSESPPTPALPGKSLAGLRGGGGPAARPAPPGSQSGLCLRQPGAQRSHSGPSLGSARADSGPGAGPGKEGDTVAPEGAGLRPPAGHRAQFGFLLALCSSLRSKKWGPVRTASLVKGFPALTAWSDWSSAFRVHCTLKSPMQRDVFPPPTFLFTLTSGTDLRVSLNVQDSDLSPTSKGGFVLKGVPRSWKRGMGLCLAGEQQCPTQLSSIW